MRREPIPTPGVVALATGELMVAARRTVATLPAGTEPRAAVAEMREALSQLWPTVPPESVRDVLIGATELASELGITEVPEDLSAELAELYPGELDGADGMLDLMTEWVNAGRPIGPGAFTPPVAFASSTAFDRDEDEETLTSLAVLLAISHLALAEREAAEREPEPEPESEDYDPGPEVDDEGGMSEYRHVLPDDPF